VRVEEKRKMPLKIRTLLRVTQFAGLALASVLLDMNAVAGTSNLGFLNNTPMAYMKQPDMDSLNSAIDSTLDSKPDGETAAWNNQGLGNSVPIDASLTPTQTSTQDQQTCRHLAVTLRAKGQSLDLHPQYCRAGKAKWQLLKRN
jgi:surface antigen